jgi:Fic family protein
VLNYRQLAVVNHALKNPYFTYTFESHRGSHNISYQTARTDLLTLADFELLDRGKDGKTIIFVAPPDLHDRVERLRDAEHR